MQQLSACLLKKRCYLRLKGHQRMNLSPPGIRRASEQSLGWQSRWQSIAFSPEEWLEQIRICCTVLTTVIAYSTLVRLGVRASDIYVGSTLRHLTPSSPYLLILQSMPYALMFALTNWHSQWTGVFQCSGQRAGCAILWSLECDLLFCQGFEYTEGYKWAYKVQSIFFLIWLIEPRLA